MTDWLSDLFGSTPELALFASLFLGYLIGRIKLGPISLGGIAGTLIVAIVIGQLGVTISDDAKNIAFATFIFALGFTAGPQFFANLNREGLKLGTFTLVEIITVVGLIVLWTTFLGLDPGTASGLMAGAATESAVLGTATDAIGGLDIPAETISTWQANVATAYSLSYLFGLITIVLFTSQIAPALLRVDLREQAAAIWVRMGGAGTLKVGQSPAAPRVVGRVHRVTTGVGLSIRDVEAALEDRVAVEKMSRDGVDLDVTPQQVLNGGDLLLLVGRRSYLVKADDLIGPEQDQIESLQMAVESREVWITNRDLTGRTLKSIGDETNTGETRGVYVGSVARGLQQLPPLPDTVVHQGDIVTLTGTPSNLDRAVALVGRLVPKTNVTDFVFLGAGVALGILIGKVSLALGSVPVSLGTGGGCLLTGLVFGWYQSRHPTIGNYPPAAAQFAKDLGLATFIAATGLSVGPQAAELIGQFGILLPIAGILTVVIPASVSLFIGMKVLKVEMPILLGAIAGQQCSTPAGTAVVEKAGNTVPMLGYTVTYALSNVLLPLLGPLIVLITFQMGAWQ